MSQLEEQNTDVAGGAVELLNDLCWHDSVLYEVRLVRRNSADQVVLSLELLDDWERYISRETEIVFEGCYAVQTQMHWGVECMSDGEMIDSGEAADHGRLIESTREAWKGLMRFPPLAQFHMALATGSVIELVFASVTIRYCSAKHPHSAPTPYYPKPEE